MVRFAMVKDTKKSMLTVYDTDHQIKWLYLIVVSALEQQETKTAVVLH